MNQNPRTYFVGASPKRLPLCVLLLALGSPAMLKAVGGLTFGMKYSGTAAAPLGFFTPSTGNTGCTGNTVAVGVELHTANGKNVGAQMLCGTPSAIGFWTDANRADFVGASGTAVIRSVCPSGMAITQVTLDILGLDLGCSELRADLTTGVTSVGVGEPADATVITNDNAPISHTTLPGQRWKPNSGTLRAVLPSGICR